MAHRDPAHRLGAGIAGGDELDVDIELDTAPRVVVVPDDVPVEDAPGSSPEHAAIVPSPISVSTLKNFIEPPIPSSCSL